MFRKNITLNVTEMVGKRNKGKGDWKERKGKRKRGERRKS